MKPANAHDCLRHLRIGGVMLQSDYVLALARIEQLVAAERAIARQEQDEAHARQAGALLYKPISTEEAAG